ncbi:spermatogenesis-associated protein 5-like protein 1 isoform X2 [Ischnura elegans]|uniref:spermatogenesis-associated protein 5-like protein 1 isoform X2 n=1 Tax=Ischnura elegans TaxID=197161 RepID=UPI001ED87CBF|nr:spermatogenesis-associated protein 5-like protein 1 isoform X2 [Ischnura elegans]
MAMRVLPLPSGISSLQKCYLPLTCFDDLGESFRKYALFKFQTGYCIVKLFFSHNLSPSCCYIDTSVSSFLNSPQRTFLDQITPIIIPQGGPFDAKSVNISLIFENLDRLVQWKKKYTVLVLHDLLKFFVIANETHVFFNGIKDYLDLGIAYIKINGIRGKKTASDAVYKVVPSTDIRVDGEFTTEMVQLETVYRGGMEKTFNLLVDVVNNRKLTNNLFINQNVLLVGPAGCGKKTLIKAVAKHCKSLVIEVDGSEVLCPKDCRGKPGEIEENIRRTFDSVKTFCEILNNRRSGKNTSKNTCSRRTEGSLHAHPIVILLLAHIELMCPNRKHQAGAQTTQFLGAMDSLENLDNLIIFATTDAVDEIDPAIRRPRRLDQEVYMGIPSEADRCDIIKNILVGDEMESSRLVDVTQVARTAATLTPGRVAAELSLLCCQVKWMHIKRNHENTEKEDTDYSSQWLHDFTYCAGQLPVSSLIGGPGTLISGSALDGAPELSSIGGLQGIKERLVISVREPLLHPESFRRLGIRPPRGVLLYGPPGCAKTTLARALASSPTSSESSHTITFLSCSAAELYSPFVGDSEKTVVELFQRARCGAPSIVFIDELDALFGSRDGMHKGGVQERVLAALLMEIDGVGHRMVAPTVSSLSSSDGQMMKDPAEGKNDLSSGNPTNSARQYSMEPFSQVTVIAATNRPDLIDDALLRPGRLDQLIYIPPPNEDARFDILSYYTSKMPVEGGDKSSLLRELAQATDLYSGADLKNLCKEAALTALSEEGFEVEAVKKEHFFTALKSTRSSLTPDMLLSYQKFSGNKFLP